MSFCKRKKKQSNCTIFLRKKLFRIWSSQKRRSKFCSKSCHFWRTFWGFGLNMWPFWACLLIRLMRLGKESLMVRVFLKKRFLGKKKNWRKLWPVVSRMEMLLMSLLIKVIKWRKMRIWISKGFTVWMKMMWQKLCWILSRILLSQERQKILAKSQLKSKRLKMEPWIRTSTHQA